MVNVISILENELITNDIQYGSLLKGSGHRSFKPVDAGNILSITFLREPVARTVSHWCHIYGNKLTDNINNDKQKFLDSLHENPERGIINYQTKFITYDGIDEVIDLNENGFPISAGVSELALAKNRLAKVDYVFDMKNQGAELTRKLLVKLYDHFQILPSIPLDTFVVELPEMVNLESTRLLGSLTSSERTLVENLIAVDMELYNTTSFCDYTLI